MTPRRALVILIVSSALIRLIAAFNLGLGNDEAYHFLYAAHPALSYYDHPPMVAYLIAFSTKLFGDNLFGIRFFGCVIGFVVLYCLGALSREKTIVACLLFSPLAIFGAILMTPDIPLLLFWTLYLYWLTKINRTFAEWSGDPRR